MSWLKEEKIAELKLIMKDDYNLEMTDNEAEEFGTGLITVFDLLLETYREQKFECTTRSIDLVRKVTV